MLKRGQAETEHFSQPPLEALNYPCDKSDSQSSAHSLLNISIWKTDTGLDNLEKHTLQISLNLIIVTSSQLS